MGCEVQDACVVDGQHNAKAFVQVYTWPGGVLLARHRLLLSSQMFCWWLLP